MKKLAKFLKEIIALIINLSLIPNLIRSFIAKRKVTILLYHNPNREFFKKHLAYLSKKYKFITIDTLINAINKKDWSHIPTFPMIITFDDGHKNNYHLIDICKKYKLNPTIYVCTKIVNSHKAFWFNFVGNKEKDSIKKISEKERKEILMKKYNFFQNKQLSITNRQALNKDEVLKMRKFFNFQSHSQYHSILTTCDDEECFNDINKSRTDLKKIIKSPFDHFSYPNGDYSTREILFLKKTKYKSGRTCDVGWSDINSDPYKLKICLISDKASINMLKAQVSGVTGFLRYLTKGSFYGKKKINTI